MQFFNGSAWVDVPGQVRTPDVPQANYNLVTFPQLTTQRVRVLMTRTEDFGIGVKELQVFDAVTCTRTISGLHAAPLDVLSGVTCLTDRARVVGPVRVRRGGSLLATGARITGQVAAIDGATIELFDSTITGPVRITGSTQRVAIAGSQIAGPVTVSGNATGTVPIVIAGNRIVGPLACTGNQPAPTNGGHTNDVTGPRSGQCAAL